MSQSLNLLGATLNSTTSIADFSNFTKVKVAASNSGDAAARNDYVNTKISEINNSNNVLKLGSSTETISSLGTITANKSYISVTMDANSSNILLNINAVNTLENGAVIILQANTPSSTITVNSNKNIRLNSSVSCSLTGHNTLQLVYSSVSNSWLELNRTIIAAPIDPQLTLSNITKFDTDASFSLSSLVTKNGTGVLSYSLNSSSVATINNGVVTIVGVGSVTITVSLTASDDGLYSQATTTALLTVTLNDIILKANSVTIQTTLSQSSITSFPRFIYANPRGTGSQWFAVVDNSSKSMISDYANNLSSGSGYTYFTTSGNVVPFNNIVTTFMTNMSNMFDNASNFNQNIGSWDTLNVTNMTYMFRDAFAFNQNIGYWNTLNVTDMSFMFSNAYSFNNNGNNSIGNWNTLNVTDMDYMFYNASNFNRNISSWNVTNVVRKPPTDFATGAGSNLIQPIWQGGNATPAR